MRLFKPGGKLHFLKNLYWRFRYGAGCCDTYSLYHFLAPKLSRVLRAYKQDSVNVGDAEHKRAVDEMIFGFDWYAGNIKCEDKDEDAFEIRAQSGVEQFGKKFRNLWW